MGPKKWKGYFAMTIEQPKQFILPRLARNKSELDKLLTARGIVSQWPAVWEQLPGIIIEGLLPCGYNPCIFRHKCQLLLLYRFHADTSYHTKLAIAELDNNFKVLSNQELDLNDDNSCEDGRLFEQNGKLYMFFVSSTFPELPGSQVKCVMLEKPDKWRASGAFEYWLPDRQTTEKNHLPLYFEGALHVLYHHNLRQEDGINQIVYTPADKREMKTPALRWPWGEIRGGTNPIPYQGRLLTFFHSMMMNEMSPQNLRYYCGAALLKADLPFQMLAVSKRPVLRGSEIGGDKTKNHFKSGVVFPMGAIENDGGWMVSVGINDSASGLIKVMPKDLNL